MKTTQNGDLQQDDFRRGVLEWRNTPRADGRSPAQHLFGRPLLSFIFAHHRSFAEEWQKKADSMDLTEADAKCADHYNQSSRPLPPLKIGVPVAVQDHRSKLWSATGIVAVGRCRDYYVRLPSGGTYWRNRRYLKPVSPLVLSLPASCLPVPDAPSAVTVAAGSAVPAPVSPVATRCQVDQFNISSTRGQSYD